jgi:thiamine biosynthesis protein ThiI
MTQIIVRYAEIALKGGARSAFEKRLVLNIRKSLGLPAEAVKRERGQILVGVSKKEVKKKLEELTMVFGIAWLAQVESCPSEKDAIVKAALDLVKNKFVGGETFAVRATRSDKSLAFTSKDIENWVGDAVRKELGVKVNLTKPDKTVFISIGKDISYLFTEKICGLGGLPVGTSGKMLSLLSGGFDSIASSFLMAKRGAQVDFLHFHVFPQKTQVLSSKMPKIWNKLSWYTLSKQVFLASYVPFQMQVLELGRREERYELVVFRRLMVRVGELLASKHGYKALVLGDSLGQVASQTIENIIAVEAAVAIPIFRPLIGFDKNEGIELVGKIGLNSEVNEAYKDCCSMIFLHPATRADLMKTETIEKRLKIEELARKIANSVERIGLN